MKTNRKDDLVFLGRDGKEIEEIQSAGTKGKTAAPAEGAAAGAAATSDSARPAARPAAGAGLAPARKDQVVFLGRDGKEIEEVLRAPKEKGPRPARGGRQIEAGRAEKLVFMGREGKEIEELVRVRARRGIDLTVVGKPLKTPPSSQKPETARAAAPWERREDETGAGTIVFLDKHGEDMDATLKYIRKVAAAPRPPSRFALYWRKKRVFWITVIVVGVVLGGLIVRGHVEFVRSVRRQQRRAELSRYDPSAEARRFALAHMSHTHIALKTAELPHEEILRRHAEGDMRYKDYVELYRAKYDQLMKRHIKNWATEFESEPAAQSP